MRNDKSKKPIKKLSVKREKVRDLQQAELSKARGGLGIDGCSCTKTIISAGTNHNQALLRA